jgi:hypothetical protein
VLELIHVLAAINFLPGASDGKTQLLLEQMVELAANLLGSCDKSLRDDISHDLLKVRLGNEHKMSSP